MTFKVYSATLGTESHSFSPLPTDMDSFRDTLLLGAGELKESDMGHTFSSPQGAATRRAKTQGWDVVIGPTAFAQPSGPVNRDTYEELRDDLLQSLKSALPVDMVLLSMHGAMIAIGYDDCEGDVLAKVRALVGPDVPIGVELDPHCHMTEKMTTNADVIVIFKEYPHTDYRERAEELAEITSLMAQGKISPVMSVHECGMVELFQTTKEPMLSFLNRVRALEGKDSVLSISLVHGFPWGDVPDLGSKVLVITDGNAEKGMALAEELSREFFELRGKCRGERMGIGESLDLALATEGGPIILGDGADNAGGGAPSDSSYILEAILERGINDVAVGIIWDPMAVKLAIRAGEGAQIDLRFCGKTCALSGNPIDLNVTVKRIVRDATQTFSGFSLPIGDAVAISSGSVDIVLSAIRGQVLGIDAFTQFGIDLAAKKIVVVKSMHHFYDAFGPIARKVIYVDAPGVVASDLNSLPFRKIRRPLWPFDKI